MESVVIFGAGNIGRGFIGQLFSESGYYLHFVDIDETLIDSLNGSNSYQVLEVDNDFEELLEQLINVSKEQADSDKKRKIADNTDEFLLQRINFKINQVLKLARSIGDDLSASEYLTLIDRYLKK